MRDNSFRPAAVVLLAVVLPLASCSSSALAITCEEFLGLSSSEQEEIIVEWTEQDSVFEDGALRDVEASQNVALMIEHCQGHPGDRLEDLEKTFGFG